MPTWAYWALFFVVAAAAIAFAKRLDDRERQRSEGARPRRNQT